MARIRHIKIENFRCIQKFEWCPNPGINCLIGHGDSGKSSILDAIDMCLGARRGLSFTDADFYHLDVANEISISITLGELDDDLKSMESYGLFLRGFDPTLCFVADEPEANLETVLTVNLRVGSDLEPAWSLVSDRAAAQNQSRALSWGDRVRICPTRIGENADSNLSWRRGSVLNQLSDEKADASAALAKAARDARLAFGDAAEPQLGETLKIVTATATELGIPVGGQVKALLDAHSVSFGGGTISLHGADGVPLRGLGVGSTRLLVAGLQRKAATDAKILLVDELEHGLEPHRIIRFLGSIGAKETPPPLQVFLTTHSPVALRELKGDQLILIRKSSAGHAPQRVGTDHAVQGTIRLFPEAFLAPSVIICEGATEVGLLRGLDIGRVDRGLLAMGALGVALVDAGGVDKIYSRAQPLLNLGYRVAVLRDDDKQPDPATESKFLADGGAVVRWRPGFALEDELFHSLSEKAARALMEKAVQFHGDELIEQHIRGASNQIWDLTKCRNLPLDPAARAALATAAKGKATPWFKNVGLMEEAAREAIDPDHGTCQNTLSVPLNWLFTWMANAGA